MIKIFDTPDLLITGLADFVVQTAKDSIQLRGKFDFVLSGGSSPKRLYELLASDSHRELIDWSRVCFFFGDERNVPHDHPDSNYLMVKRALFQPLAISDKQVFPINTAKLPTQAAADYEQLVRNHFEPGHYGFDLVLLGLGDNSHTASLFPHTPVLHEQHALVKEVFVPEVNMYRITITAPLINAARNVAFLVYGASKAEAVYHIVKGERNIESHPAQLIKPTSGKLMWFLDQEAGKKL